MALWVSNTVISNQELCVGCNRCVRECPIELANLVIQDENGGVKVQVDSAKCIACGACMAVCKHDARSFADDIDRFFHDLAHGVPITLIIAPAVRTNFPQWQRLLAYFRALGAQAVYDVSLGADICVWAHLRYIQRDNPGPFITQPCPAVVSYCEIHRPELVEKLSPVHSPMGCMAAYLREYEGVRGRIAAISPCIAKSNEFTAIGTVDYSITFSNLQAHLEKNAVALPERGEDFDGEAAGPGTLFPTPGGFKENLAFFTGDACRIDKAEGRGVYALLDQYAETPEGFLPNVFDVLSCAGGCSAGSACARTQNPFAIQSAIHSVRREVTGERARLMLETRHRLYDHTLDLAKFMRQYQPLAVVSGGVSEADIQRAFALLEKDTYAKQNFDCGACGSNTCRDMARKIALGLNVPVNCIVKSRDNLRNEHARNTELYRRNARYIELVHSIGEYLLAADDDTRSGVALNSVQALGTALNAGGVYVMKYFTDANGRRGSSKVICWPEDDPSFDVVYDTDVQSWFDHFVIGEPLNKLYSEMNPRERGVFKSQVSASILGVPIMIKGALWGFVAVHSGEEVRFDDEEISVITASGLLIVSSIIEQEMTRSLIVAREEALVGTRAKSDFLSHMSHEMRTPMNAIIGMTKIADKTDDVERLHYCLDTINASALHLLGLINDVLDMSKIEAGKFELDIAPFDMERMLMNMCDIIIARAESKRQKLTVIMGDDLKKRYVGDEMRLSQVLANLLSNAVKFTPEDGKITLLAEEIGTKGTVGSLRFSVVDTGIGMTEDQVNRLFNAFEQVHSGSTYRAGGTGLGLAISRSIVEKMGGALRVISHAGKGSEFVVAVDLQYDTRIDDNARLATNAGDIRLLIVESNDETRALFQSISDRFGIASDAAGTGREAITLLQRRAYDVVFLDYGLPDMTSLEMLDAAGDAIDRDRVIIVSSFLEWHRVEDEVKAAGLTRFLSKPLFPSSVLNAISQVFGRALRRSSETAVARATIPDFSSIRLLLAEDIAINREIFAALLEPTHIVIDTAETGVEAVNRFSSTPDAYDIIIMDVQMPEMDGLEATRAIRALSIPQARHIPIVAMTANAFREDVEACLASGMNDHLAKPIDEQALMDKIAQYTGKA